MITTGTGTGSAPSKEQIDYFAKMVSDFDLNMPIGVGSGVTPEAIINGLLQSANFAIVGSYFKDGRVKAEKVKSLMQIV